MFLKLIIKYNLDYEDLPYVYKMSKMLVMPSLFESISIPVFEAFALKVPVCCSNVVALPEQIGDAGLLFEPFDVEDMAFKILKILDDEILAKSLAEKGYKRLKKYSHQDYKEELRHVLAAITTTL